MGRKVPGCEGNAPHISLFLVVAKGDIAFSCCCISTACLFAPGEMNESGSDCMTETEENETGER